MSTLINSARAGVRTRVPRFAEAAVERARLTVVPPRRSLGRTQAARTPFAVLVLAMLAAGVVGLLMFNTNMQQASFKATALQEQVTTLTAQQQSLNMELDQLRDPQHLATAAKKLGMVAPAQPGFIQLGTGTVLGQPVPATPDEAVRINSLPSQLPTSVRQKTIFVKAKPPTAVTTPPATTGKAGTTTSTTDTPGTSTHGAGQNGKKKANTSNSATGATD
jgi:hypothetical protein